MHRVSALLPSWDRSRQATPAPKTPTTPTTPTTTSTSPLPKSPGALNKVFGWAEKIVVPVTGSRNSSTTPNTTGPPPLPARYGRETYWPTSLDKECDKAARIIKSFCFDGFLSQEHEQTEETERRTEGTATGAAEPVPSPTYVTKKIPPRIIQNAVGLAVFSCMRSGLWMSGSGGAGLITARKADGTWSPPSAIILHTAELAFVMGVDIYDCVLVINSVQTLELFTRPKLILGADVSLAVGPLVVAGGQDPEIRWREISGTVLTYVKARGKHQAVQLDGSLVTERGNENERFYCAGVTILDILAGNIPKEIPEMRPLFEVIKAAEGRSDYDKALMDWLAEQPAPGDADIESPKESVASPTAQAFGLPDANDPDPFGVIGLEMAGIEIREAGSQLRPTSTQFEYHPSPTSPVYGRFSRQSLDTFVSRSNRGSCMSARTQATAMTDAYTQTDVASTADTSYSRANSDDGKDSVERLPTVPEPDEVDYTKVDTSIIERLKRRTVEIVAPEPVHPAETKEAEIATITTLTTETATVTEVGEEVPEEKLEETDERAAIPDSSLESLSPSTTDEQDEDADDEDEEEDEDDEPIICEVATASAQPTRSSIQKSQLTQVIQAKGAIVTIPKRIPPPLPARSPARASRGSKSDYGDVSSLRSPIRNSFLSIESRADDASLAAETRSLDDTLATSEPTTTSTAETAQEPALMQRPASPRHQKNSSSVCTAVAIETTTITTTTAQPEDEKDTPAVPTPILEYNDNTNDNEDKASIPRTSTATPPSTTSSTAPPDPDTPQTLVEPGSSAEDEYSEREPQTPRTTAAETEFDTASEEHQYDADEHLEKQQPVRKSATVLPQEGQGGETVRIVEASGEGREESRE